MKYLVEHESRHTMRIRLYTGSRQRLTKEEAEVLEYALSAIQGMQDVEIYAATSGACLTFECPKELVHEKLSALNFENVTYLAEKIEPAIDEEELRIRKLSPSLRRKMRKRIVVEAVADLFLPWPIQLAYHGWQLITLKSL